MNDGQVGVYGHPPMLGRWMDEGEMGEKTWAAVRGEGDEVRSGCRPDCRSAYTRRSRAQRRREGNQNGERGRRRRPLKVVTWSATGD